MIQQTSLLAYRGIGGELGRRESEVYAVIKGSGKVGMTNLEISRALRLPINSITGRTNKLVKKGMIYGDGRRLDKHTERYGIVWRCI